jgi:hypothetical protein
MSLEAKSQAEINLNCQFNIPPFSAVERGSGNKEKKPKIKWSLTPFFQKTIATGHFPVISNGMTRYTTR